jgi:hypothetical protein
MNLDSDDSCTCDVGVGDKCQVCARYDTSRHEPPNFSEYHRLKKEKARKESLSLVYLMDHYHNLK